MTWRIFGALAGAAATAGVVAVLAAPGGSNNSILDPVAQAADTTVAAGTADFGITGSVTKDGQRVALSGNGAVDMRSQRARVSLGVPVPVLGSVQADAILDGGSIYVHLPAALAAAKPWVKADLAQLGKRFGLDAKQLQSSSGASPAAIVKTLEAVGASRKVGDERVAGVSTVHYRATIDPQKALQRIPNGAAAAAVQQLLVRSGLRSIPVDVWIDDSGRVRRESIHFAAAHVAGDVTLTFTRFGGPVSTTPPPADQVTDVGALLGAS